MKRAELDAGIAAVVGDYARVVVRLQRAGPGPPRKVDYREVLDNFLVSRSVADVARAFGLSESGIDAIVFRAVRIAADLASEDAQTDAESAAMAGETREEEAMAGKMTVDQALDRIIEQSAMLALLMEGASGDEPPDSDAMAGAGDACRDLKRLAVAIGDTLRETGLGKALNAELVEDPYAGEEEAEVLDSGAGEAGDIDEMLRLGDEFGRAVRDNADRVRTLLKRAGRRK